MSVEPQGSVARYGWDMAVEPLGCIHDILVGGFKHDFLMTSIYWDTCTTITMVYDTYNYSWLVGSKMFFP